MKEMFQQFFERLVIEFFSEDQQKKNSTQTFPRAKTLPFLVLQVRS